MTFEQVASVARALDTGSVCPACGGEGLMIFHEQEGVPVHSCRLLASREEALAFPRGRLRLGACPTCGFITNTAYDASVQDYGIAYEETQGFSPRFQEFARSLAEELVRKHGLVNKRILEIGCGKGEFLALLCELGENSGIGIDPSVVPERLESPAIDRLTFIRELFSERHLDIDADFILCRHTLEHIHDVAGFLDLVGRVGGDASDIVFFLEVPESMRILREVAFWDIYYEHCSYFTKGSLARALTHAGFVVQDAWLEFDDQYLLVDAQPARFAPSADVAVDEPAETILHAARDFQTRFAAAASRWGARLGSLGAAGTKVVVWGSGSKGVAFLTTVGGSDVVEYVVDVNPYRHGMFMPGTGQEIVAPDFLRDYRPDQVIVMNPIYVDEIGRMLRTFGVAAELVPLDV